MNRSQTPYDRRMGPQDINRQSLQGLHIIVVDADEDARILLETVLTYAGALVTLAASAEAALDSIARVVPEIVVCALNLASPRDGAWFLGRLRGLPAGEGGTRPVIALTNPRDSESAASHPHPGFQAYLAKPIDTWALCRLIAELADPRGKSR